VVRGLFRDQGHGRFQSSPALAEQARTGHLRSGWSSARCGALRFNNCIRVVRVDDGFVVQLMRMFGGGYLAIPDQEIRQVEKAKLLWWTRVMVFTDARDFCFYGAAGECVWSAWQDRPGEMAKGE
jgi:hypothetical protein